MPVRTFARRGAPFLTAFLLSAIGSAAHAAPVDFNLPAQPLGQAIQQLAHVSGLTVGVDSALVAGKTAPAVKGRLEPAEALRRLLAGSGLAATISGNDVVVTAANGPVTLAPVKVAAGPIDGSAAAGYRSEATATTGPWGQLPIQDTPYSISVMPSELIENVQAEDMTQLYKMNPLTQSAWNVTQYDDNSNTVAIRGFPTAANLLFDGVNMPDSADNSLEDKERVEVFSGLTGFLYGADNYVGGVVNWVLKRPTATPFHEITVGDYGGGQFYTHVDLGGPLVESGKLAYRLNIVKADGNTAVNDQSLNRYLYSGALDWHVTDNFLLQANASNQSYDIHGPSGVWASLAAGATRPSPPPADQLYSQKWGFIKTQSTNYGLKATWDVNDIFKVRAEYQHAIDQRTSIYNINDYLTSSGTYTQFHDAYSPTTTINDGVYLYLDSKFRTLFIDHALTVGFSDSFYQYQQYANFLSSFALDTLSFSNPFVSLPENFSNTGKGPIYTSSKVTYQNYVIGDNIKFNDQWSALVGVNYAYVYQGAFNLSAVETSNYYKGAVTPSVSLLFKPRPWLTTYVTYMEGLQPGTIVGSIYTNAGQPLPPLVDTEYEVGAKATVGGLLLTGALFQIEQANEYSNNATPIPTFVQNGLVVNKGIELTATGNVVSGLRVFGGITLLDPTVERTNTPSYNDKRPVNVADVMAKLYAEYDLPFVPGLTLTGGVYYTGQQYGDSLNTDNIPAYVVADIGARYTVKLKDNELIFRLDATNIAGANYWQNSATVGAPRTVQLSASIKF